MFKEIFFDATGAISTMRVCTFIIVVSICSVYLAQNVLSMIQGHGLVSMSTTDVSALGVALVAKFGQTFTEKPTTPPVEGADSEVAEKSN